MTTSSKSKRRLQDAYTFPGFRPRATIKGIFGDPKARIVTLVRRSKKHAAAVVVWLASVGTTAKCGAFVTCPVATHVCTWNLRYGGSNARVAAK
jgi:hypothetical protein